MINLSMADPEHNLRPRLTVMGVGGAGGNAINNMIRCQLEGCDFIAANTDSQALSMSLAQRKIQLGANLSRGLGAGSKPDIGRAAAEEQLADIMACLEGSDMIFVTAGMGGGTGTGAAPVIARAARESGILTVGIVTKPFHFEGATRMRQAEAGIAELQQYVDTLIVIPNQNLFRIANERTTFAEAFRLADEVLHSGVRGITDLMVMEGFMNLDFADVKTVMGEMGKAMMGTGEAGGENRAILAAEAAISNPLLDDVSMKGARGVLVNITGGMDMTLFEVDQAANRIRDEVDPDAQIKVGSTLGQDLEGRIRVSVIATGIDVAPIQVRTSSGSTESVMPRSEAVMARRAATAALPPAASVQSTAVQTAPAAQPVTASVASAPKPTATATSQTHYFTMPQAINPQVLRQQQVMSQPATPPAAQSAESLTDAGSYDSPAATASELTPPPSFAAPRAQPSFNARPTTPPQMIRPNVQPSSAPLSASPASSSPAASSAPASPLPASVASSDLRMTQLSAASATPPAPATTPPNAAEQRRMRRSESLFTRITGFGLVRPSAQQPEDPVADLSSPEDEATQAKHLGIDPADRPALSSESNDLLDIPAFLRRQTNH